MDMDFMGQLMLSVLIFAPGVVLFVACALVGVAVLLEKIGVLADIEKDTPDDDKVDTIEQQKLPPAGVIRNLSEAIAAEDEYFRDGTNN